MSLPEIADVALDAMDQRDETRRWLLDIATKMGISPESSNEENPHKAWRSLYEKIIESIKP